MMHFGKFIRDKRKALLKEDPAFSQQRLSEKIGIQQSYLSKIELGTATQLSEEKIIALAEALREDPDYLLALGGKVSKDVLGIIRRRPRLFSRLVREMKNMPEDVIAADHDFKRRHSRISHLYELAGIAFFHLEDGLDDSVWSPRTPSMLNLPDTVAPSMETICSALSPASRDFFVALEEDARRNREPYHCELQLREGDHPVQHITVWGDFEVLPESGKIIRIGLIQDVTKSVLARRELKEAKEALSGTVEAQSHQVSQGIEKLKREIAARRILEAELREINTDVGRKKDLQKSYLKKSAYQLRSMVNRLALAENDPQSEETPLCLLGRISAAINNMNDFFEIEEGVRPLHDIFDPGRFFERLFADIQGAFPKSAIAVRLNLSPNLPRRMVADQQRVQQIAHSVMEFLLAGTLWGGIQVNVDYLEKIGVLVLAFSSSATGERIDKECFYPRPNLDARGKSWTLATVGPIVDGLGGSLDVKTTPSNGVDIILQIPARPTGDDIPAIDEARTVLVVEDDEFSRLYTERALDKLGFEVESVRLGEEAVSKAGERQYGLILLDIQLPDSDGVTVARRIRSPEGPNAATRIIAVTAHATPEDRHRYEKAGIDQFIAKPFKIETLAEAMGKGASTGKSGR